MKGYVPGEQPKDGKYIKLNTNENPYPPSPKVLAAVKEAVNENLRLYPDPLASGVRIKVASLFGIDAQQVIVGNGSDDLLTMIIRCFVGGGDKAVVPYPTYSLYETLVELQDGKLISLDFRDDFSLPEDDIVQDAKVTFLSNPNSPSGTMVQPEVISKIADRLNGVLVIDEAYADFADANCMGLIHRHPNVIILRTLSKSYSLAGIRLGFGIAQKHLIDGMIKVKDSYNVDRLSMAAVIAALDDQEGMKCNVEKIRKTRGFLSERLSGLGFYVYPSQSNFVFARCPAGTDARRIYLDLKARKILVRYFEKRRASDCLRITVGTDEEIQKLLDNIADILGQSH